MIARTSINDPTNMNTSAFYNEARFVGKGGYFKGNSNYQCVNYAIGRTCELANRAVCYYSGISTKEQIEKPMMKRSGYGNAVSWLKDTLWEVGTTPKVGAVMVYGASYGGGCGHVRVVEKIDGNKLFISGANENKAMAFKWIDIPSITSSGFMGYIYNPYVEEGNMGLIKFKKEEGYEYKWSVDGNKYGEEYDITTERGFADVGLEKDGWELLLKVNGSLFYHYGTDYFACGLEKSRGVNNQDVGMSCVSKYNNCMAIAGYGEDLYFGSQEWIIKNMLEKSYCAITGMGLLMSGSKRNDMKKGFESQWTCVSGRTVIGEDAEGNFLSYSFAGETGKSGLTCSQLQDKCLELGFVTAICLDGGGSVFRQYRKDNGELVYDISTSRKVKNALLLYRRKKQVVDNSDITDTDYKMAYETMLQANEELREDFDELAAQHSSVVEQNKELQSENERLKQSLDRAIESMQNAIDTIESLL